MIIQHEPIEFIKTYATPTTAHKAVQEWAKLYQRIEEPLEGAVFKYSLVPTVAAGKQRWGVLLYGLDPAVRGMRTRAAYSGFTVLGDV